MHAAHSPLARRTLLAAALAALPVAAAAPALADGTFPEPGPFPPRNALLTYADMV